MGIFALSVHRCFAAKISKRGNEKEPNKLLLHKSFVVAVGEDEMIDMLVEGGGRYHARRIGIPFRRQVQIGRAGRLQVRIAAADRHHLPRRGVARDRLA